MPQAPPTAFMANKARLFEMYQYADFDRAFIAARNAQFRAQVARRISGELSEDEFKPLRLMNGV